MEIIKSLESEGRNYRRSIEVPESRHIANLLLRQVDAEG
jgi:hypothetical protein